MSLLLQVMALLAKPYVGEEFDNYFAAAAIFSAAKPQLKGPV